MKLSARLNQSLADIEASKKQAWIRSIIRLQPKSIRKGIARGKLVVTDLGKIIPA